MMQRSPQRLPLPKASKSIGRAVPHRIPLNNLQIILIALVVISGRLIIDFSQRILEGQNKIKEQHALEAEIAELTRTQQQLEANKAYYSSPSYVEAWAHDQGKMVRGGEVLVIPVYAQRTRTGLAVTSSETVRPLPTWQVWWSLFFDSPSPFTSSTHSPEGVP